MNYRLSNAYGLRWPLSDEDGITEEAEVQLSDGLRKQIIVWAAYFNENYDPLAGWPTSKTAREQERQGQRLQKLIEKELPEGDVVTFLYWEVNHRKGL